MKHAIPHIAERGGGIVINTASFVGTTVPFPDGVLYGATKAAVLSMTRSVAAGSAEQNVRVFAVCPWITDTPMVDRLTGHRAEAKAQFGGINPSGRIATPEDIAGVVLSIFTGGADLESGDAVLVDSGGTTEKSSPCPSDRNAVRRLPRLPLRLQVACDANALFLPHKHQHHEADDKEHDDRGHGEAVVSGRGHDAAVDERTEQR